MEASSEVNATRGVVLLSLDGGGIRGLSEVVILETLLHRYKVQNRLSQLPRPAEVFDLIGGTSTGGLIALMAGRLGMSIDEIKDAYQTLAKEVFSGTKRGASARLEEIVKRLVCKHTGDANARLMSGPGSISGFTCNAFVCAKAAVHAAGRVTVFRTYEHPYEPGIDPPIWQVARATCTISDFLDQISIDEVRYIDCGMGVSNPVKVVLREADAIYVQRPLSCIISIGSGQAETIDIRRPSWWKRIAFGTISDGAIRAVQAIATDCEADADDVHTRLCFKLGDKIDDHYIRFNADRGMQSVRLNKWERLGDVKALTMDYLGGPETRAKASRAVNGMTSREGITGSLNQTSVATPRLILRLDP